MAVAFTYKLWGTAGGPGREHTRANVTQAGRGTTHNMHVYCGVTVIRG